MMKDMAFDTRPAICDSAVSRHSNAGSRNSTSSRQIVQPMNTTVAASKSWRFNWETAKGGFNGDWTIDWIWAAEIFSSICAPAADRPVLGF